MIRSILTFILLNLVSFGHSDEREDSSRSPDAVGDKAYIFDQEEKERSQRGTLIFNFSVASDYVWRGLSQSSNGAAVQGGVDYEWPQGLKVGAWVSSMGPFGSEADFYASYSLKLNENLKLTTGATFYHYRPNGAGDTGELSFGADLYGFDLNLNYTSDYFGSKAVSWYYNLSRQTALADDLAVSFAMGYTSFDRNREAPNRKSYINGSVSLDKKVQDWGLSLFYSDTNRRFRDDHVFGVLVNRVFQ